MSLTYQQVAHAAMQLSPTERVGLADKLWVSVDTPETIAAERARYDGLLMAGLRLLAPELPKIEDQ